MTQLFRYLSQGWRSLAHDDASYYLAATDFVCLAATFAYDAIRWTASLFSLYRYHDTGRNAVYEKGAKQDQQIRQVGSHGLVCQLAESVEEKEIYRYCTLSLFCLDTVEVVQVTFLNCRWQRPRETFEWSKRSWICQLQIEVSCLGQLPFDLHTGMLFSSWENLALICTT